MILSKKGITKDQTARMGRLYCAFVVRKHPSKDRFSRVEARMLLGTQKNHLNKTKAVVKSIFIFTGAYHITSCTQAEKAITVLS